MLKTEAAVVAVVVVAVAEDVEQQLAPNTTAEAHSDL